MKNIINSYINQHIALANSLLDEEIVDKVVEITAVSIETIRNGGKLVVFGNGGSAADAQHIVTELVSRFKRERKALPALSLNNNVSILTAVANDYSYDSVFARQVEALVNENDVVIGISTSGISPSVIEGIRAAHQKGARTMALTGKDGGLLKDAADICLIVPSDDTWHIQEMHITLGHIICDLIERELS